MPILLFDIDGTLVRTGGAGKLAMETALTLTFGVCELLDRVPYSGRTDRAIARDLLTIHSIEPTPANQDRLRDAYLAQLPLSLKQLGGNACPGIPELLADLRPRSSVTLGLLTGNVRTGARHKLGHFGLWEFFCCGGFGDEHFDRDDVARMAMTEVRTHLGRDVHASDVWIIGDTPLDVQCARAVGAKAVAVATGWHTADELAKHAPDYLFSDLTQAEELLQQWR